MLVHKGQKHSNPIFKESYLQINLVFLLRHLCFIAFFFPLCSIFYIWMENKIYKRCYLGETVLLLTHLALNCDSLGCSYFILKRSGTTLLLFNVFVVWLVFVLPAFGRSNHLTWVGRRRPQQSCLPDLNQQRTSLGLSLKPPGLLCSESTLVWEVNNPRHLLLSPSLSTVLRPIALDHR